MRFLNCVTYMVCAYAPPDASWKFELVVLVLRSVCWYNMHSVEISITKADTNREVGKRVRRYSGTPLFTKP